MPVALWLGAGLALAVAGASQAEWLQPDPSYREAQLVLRMAARDTAGHADDPARLDSLGVALLRVGRLADARPLLERSLETNPGDDAAEAALGKIALFEGRLDEAARLLAHAESDPGAVRDLYALRLRREEWNEAARLAPDADDQGRVALLEAMAEAPVYAIPATTQKVDVPWSVSYPVPLVRVKLNGQSVLMAIDTGSADLLVDESTARRCRVRAIAGQRIELWMGSRIAVRNAMVERLEIGGLRVGRLPAGTLNLRKWSIEVNPHAEQVAGVIGLGLLERFTPTMDYKKSRLELRPRGVQPAFAAGATRVPFQLWGASELTLWGSMAGGRRMAFIVQTGVPGCGVGAPSEVFDEVGVKPGVMSRLVKGAGTWLAGRAWSQVVVPTVSFGPVVGDRLSGWSGALESSELWRHGVRRDALLSHDFFRGRRVTIDWEQQELVFEEP
jgi:hypothetical protein